jgi:hypothetical protein
MFNALILIYYTSGLNECLTSDGFNSASGEAASALTSQVTSFFTLFFAKIILEDEINDFFSPRSPSTYYRLLLLNIVIIVECIFKIYVSDQSCQLSYLFALYKMIVTNTELFCSCVRLITLDGGN